MFSKKTKFLYSLCYIILIFLLLYIYRIIFIRFFADNYREILTLVSASKNGVLLLGILNFLIFTIFGIIIGLPNLLIEYKKDGKFTFDLIPFLVVGIPSFMISSGFFIEFLYSFGNNFELSSQFGLYLAWLSSEFQRDFFRILFGYMIVNCIKRVENKE